MFANQCLDVKVLELKALGPSGDTPKFFELCLEYPGWKQWSAGQFVMLRPQGPGFEPLWARAFSVCRVDERGLWVFFQVMGQGTLKMSKLAPGDMVTLWGPLGNGFYLRPDTRTLILAGGLGLAPFVGYVHAHPKPENLHLVFGHTVPLECYPYAEMAERVSSEEFFDQGPSDLEAFIALIQDRIREFSKDGLVLACGPPRFLQTVQKLALREGAETQLSLENRMACGVGACLGCVVKNNKGDFVQVCFRGPVFRADEVTLDEGA
ncbi:MAG: dihydroorotate dehydrogenase electron transfer subunit [Thermodesulfobacteriota bacterium]|nr:dihydroorotate dehydrogenase electron transfer subunit [Thermodesulfobacteriota bacterium]